MPAKSKAQQRLFQAAEHGAKFPMAEKLRATLPHSTLHEFASGSEAGKPQHVQRMPHPARNLGQHIKPGMHTEIVTNHHRRPRG